MRWVQVQENQNFALNESEALYATRRFVARLFSREIDPQSRIRRHFFRNSEMLGSIVTSRHGFAHHALLQATPEEAWLGPHLRTSSDLDPLIL